MLPLLQTRAETATSGDVHVAHMTTQAARRGANAWGQHHVAVGAQIRRGYGPRRRLLLRQRHGDALTRFRQHARASTWALDAGAKDTLCARSQHSRTRREHAPSTPATHGTAGPTPAATNTCERRWKILRCYGERRGARGSPRGCWWRPRTLLETRGRRRRRRGRGRWPRRGSTARAQLTASGSKLQGGID